MISSYPITYIYNILAKFCLMKYFTILEIQSGYHHIKPSERSRKLTAFSRHNYKFEWKVLPFRVTVRAQEFCFTVRKALGMDCFVFR